MILGAVKLAVGAWWKTAELATLLHTRHPDEEKDVHPVLADLFIRTLGAVAAADKLPEHYRGAFERLYLHVECAKARVCNTAQAQRDIYSHLNIRTIW